MAYEATILVDSININGNRLTTFLLKYPRFVHSELLTHRQLSRNSSSSRAIPIEKMIAQVESDPVMPVYWGKNQAGMQAGTELQGLDLEMAKGTWLGARDNAVRKARALIVHGVHKQIVNRLLEPWMWITVIISATEYENFFKLRCHEDAQPEIKHIADMMQDLYRSNVPTGRTVGEWHLPLIGFPGDETLTEAEQIKVSVGRCARVSYLTHEGTRDVAKDLQLHDWLLVAAVAWDIIAPSNTLPRQGARRSPLAISSAGDNTGRWWRMDRELEDLKLQLKRAQIELEGVIENRDLTGEERDEYLAERDEARRVAKRYFACHIGATCFDDEHWKELVDNPWLDEEWVESET